MAGFVSTRTEHSARHAELLAAIERLERARTERRGPRVVGVDPVINPAVAPRAINVRLYRAAIERERERRRARARTKALAIERRRARRLALKEQRRAAIEQRRVEREQRRALRRTPTPITAVNALSRLRSALKRYAYYRRLVPIDSSGARAKKLWLDSERRAVRNAIALLRKRRAAEAA